MRLRVVSYGGDEKYIAHLYYKYLVISFIIICIITRRSTYRLDINKLLCYLEIKNRNYIGPIL